MTTRVRNHAVARASSHNSPVYVVHSCCHVVEVLCAIFRLQTVQHGADTGHQPAGGLAQECELEVVLDGFPTLFALRMQYPKIAVRVEQTELDGRR